jgi:hypothetical protein
VIDTFISCVSVGVGVDDQKREEVPGRSVGGKEGRGQASKQSAAEVSHRNARAVPHTDCTEEYHHMYE